MDRRRAQNPRLSSRVDRELEAGSSAHYDDPAYYTANYRSRIEDIAYYVDRALAIGGPVLEYGIGNGRIALPLARHGLEVVGVDRSQPMLADLRRRLSGEPEDVRARVTLFRGDMRRARLGRRFPLVVAAFNTVLHLYAHQEVAAFLACVRAHLAPRGRFLVDLSVPSLADLLADPNRRRSGPRFRHPSSGEIVRYYEHFDYDSVRQILFVSMHFEPVGAPERAWMTPLAHRQFFPEEWRALMEHAGFELLRVDGDFTGGPLDRSSDVMIVHARAKRGK